MTDDKLIEADFVEGYTDGRDAEAPWPSGNRSAAYKHSFEVARAEKLGKPIPAQISRERAAMIAAAKGEA